MSKQRLVRVFLEITEACDSKCRLCDYWRKKQPNQLDMEYLHSVVIPLLKQDGVDRVCVTGGEPTLHPNLVSICKSLNKAGVGVTLITSTSNLKAHFEDLSSCVDAYMLSLDGYSQASYISMRGIDLYEQVLSWPEKIKSEQNNAPQVVYSCVVQKGNVHHLLDIYKLAVSSAVDGIFFRIPDDAADSFGREGSVNPVSQRASVFTEQEIDSIRHQLHDIFQLDDEHASLMQSRSFLLSIPDRLQVNKVPMLLEQDGACAAPQSSLVVNSDRTVSPCFYLPVRVDATSTNSIKNSQILNKLLTDMLLGEHDHLDQCARCNQFERWK